MILRGLLGQMGLSHLDLIVQSLLELLLALPQPPDRGLFQRPGPAEALARRRSGGVYPRSPVYLP